MSAATALAFETPRRIFQRHPIHVPVDFIALRSGVPETLPGRCTDISEAGIGAVVAGDLLPGQQIALELRLPDVGVPVRVRAIVSHHSRLRCGVEFIGLSTAQREMIRYWLYRSAARPVDFRPFQIQEKNRSQSGTSRGRKSAGAGRCRCAGSVEAGTQDPHCASRPLCAARLHAGAGRPGMVAVAEVMGRTGGVGNSRRRAGVASFSGNDGGENRSKAVAGVSGSRAHHGNRGTRGTGRTDWRGWHGEEIVDLVRSERAGAIGDGGSAVVEI